MRSISSNGLAKLATRFGTEPINIIEVDWIDGNSPLQYADRDVSGIPGRILDIGDLDNVVNLSANNSSQEITLTLDDTDGSIKAILDSHDVHKRNVRLYQHFSGLALSDKFLIFQGKLSSPITWKERDRTVSFTVISTLEDKEIGFSAEEGQFPYLPKDLVGKAWPMIFGKVLDVPALQINNAVSGSSLCGIGILSGADLHNQVALGGNDCGLGMSLAMMSEQISFLNECQFAWRIVDPVKSAELLDQSNNLLLQMQQSAQQNTNQQVCGTNQRQSKVAGNTGLGCNPVRILGGEDFPQNKTITLNIGGGLFTGTMSGDHFHIVRRSHPDNEDKAQTAFDAAHASQCSTTTPSQVFDFSMDVPPGEGDLSSSTIRRHGFIFCSTPTSSRPSVSQVAQHFWAEAGARAVIASDEPITYIVSIIPGTVLAVKAYKQLQGGERKLVNLPSNLYTVSNHTYGSITAVQIVTHKPLSTIVDQGWEDQLYVTFQSSVGPNIVDILEYLINTYTDLDFDTTSFNYVKTKLTNFPANFPILDRKNTIEVLTDIAFQARCAIWLSNGVFYLKYLPEEPSADDTITVSDLDAETGVDVELSPTEEIVTKMNVTWHLSWAAEEPEKMILRHNVKKYGTQEKDFDFYIYNQPDIVYKVATFWLIRLSKTWKIAKFKTFLQKLNLETFDTVSLNFGSKNYVASGNVKAIVEQANYNSNDQTVDFTVRTPVEAGTMVPYTFFWPASVSPTITFPTAAEIAAGWAGGDGIGKNATGNLPVGFTDTVHINGVVFVGGPNVVFGPQSDHGDRTPTDTGFVPQTIIPGTVFAELSNSANPNPDLTLNYVDPLRPPILPGLQKGSSVIDIRKTKVTDSSNPGVNATLDTIIQSISESALIIAATAKIGDGTNQAPFDFRYDGSGGKFGAGTAFLQD